MTEVTNLTDLRNLSITTDIVYVKGYYNAGDGGGGMFLWRTEAEFQTGVYSVENYGTIIKSNIVSSEKGSWVRQYDDFISVLWFGALGTFESPSLPTYTTRIQNAIDFASLNSLENSIIKGSTVFIPNGSYQIFNIILKTGVTILGESIERTIIYCPDDEEENEYLFEIESGPVFINISNLRLVGYKTNKGCFKFQSTNSIIEPFHGGLWNSRISDIEISNFKGHGVYFEGGLEFSDGLLPNQFNIFENVRIKKTTDYSNALRMIGQNGQISFINCTFDGFHTEDEETHIKTYSKGQNIHIKNDKQFTSAVVSFINCTCQDADYGILIEWAENITIDNCWFETLGVAITVKNNNADKNNDIPSKSINILNSRFANAAGFGSLEAPNNIKNGQCVNISKSFVTINSNFVIVTEPDGEFFDANSSFIVAYNNTIGGVSVQNNTFQTYKLAKTSGIMEVIEVDTSDNSIDCSGHKLLFVNGSKTVINTIKSFINAGEYLTIRANTSSITFSNSDNIFFSTLNPTNTFQLNNGEIVTFVKIDNFVTPNFGTYQLVSIMRLVD